MQMYVSPSSSPANIHSNLQYAFQREETLPDYKDIGYQYFKPVSYDRLMSWKAGHGRIVVGMPRVDENAGVDAENVRLPKDTGLHVVYMNFKMVPEDPKQVPPKEEGEGGEGEAK